MTSPWSFADPPPEAAVRSPPTDPDRLPEGYRPVPPNQGTLYFCEVSIFFDLFNPNNRHRTEELRRMENTREEEAQGEPGRGPIDLNSGAVLIRLPGTQPAADGDADAPQDAAPEDSVSGSIASEAALWQYAVPEDEDAAASGEEDGGA
jgi:Family of unknown function (DUF6191)